MCCFEHVCEAGCSLSHVQPNSQHSNFCNIYQDDLWSVYKGLFYMLTFPLCQEQEVLNFSIICILFLFY